MKVHSARVNGEDIAYRDEGVGVPVIMVHSLGTSLHIWDSTFADLKKHLRVIAFDCRGHGDSTNRGGFSVEAIADDVLALAAALRLKEFHYVGISMGGLIGVTAVSKAPDRILSLTLADSYATVGAAGPPRLAATRETLAKTPMRAFAADYVRDTIMPETPKAISDRTIDVIAGMTAENYMQTLEAILTADVTPLLKMIAVETLVIVGEKDHRTPVAVSEFLAKSIGRSRLVIVPQAGHLAVLDQPAIFNEHLLEFLKSANRTSSTKV